MKTVNLVRAGLWAVAIGAAVTAIGLSAGWFRSSDLPPGVEMVRIGGSFSLVDVDGKPVTDADFAGTPRAMFFGFTNCPDVCPTTLLEAGGWLKELGPDADKLKIVLVTVDPARDTPEALKLYLSSFDPRIVGLTGTQQQIDDVIKRYRVYARKVETEGGDYTMDHSAAVLLFDGKGDFVGTVDYQAPKDEVVAKLKRLATAG